VRADDLALAWACEAGREGAIDTFEEHFAPDLQRIVRRFSGPELPEEDLRQSLREHLFVGASERPGKIATYSGHGRLQNWLRVVATRRFTDALRAARPGREELPLGEALTDLPAGGDDHELTFMKREYRKQFGRAFSEALANLLPEERNLLRQHVVQRLTLEEMAKLRRTHASTISRRLDRVRSRLLEDTRLRLRATLQVGEGELDSILRLIRSNLDVSVSCLLELEDPPPRPT
jgi:RNA polymerase sigma-70 factor (ECF subfamily)